MRFFSYCSGSWAVFYVSFDLRDPTPASGVPLTYLAFGTSWITVLLSSPHIYSKFPQSSNRTPWARRSWLSFASWFVGFSPVDSLDATVRLHT